MADRIPFCKPTLGADIELLVVDDAGTIIDSHELFQDDTQYNTGVIEPDGIAVELQPNSSTCRESLKSNIVALLNELPSDNILFNKHTVNIEQRVFDSLDPSSLEFGCKPSFNGHANRKADVNHVGIKGTETTLRCCGGHIHIGAEYIKIKSESRQIKEQCKTCALAKIEGLNCVEYDDKGHSYNVPLRNINLHEIADNKSIKELFPDCTDHIVKTINRTLGGGIVSSDWVFELDEITRVFNENPMLVMQIMDAFVGIPSVMLDCSPDAALRRTIYGKAGDYRLPDYGIEYRTLSNFWINAYFLYSFVFGMARHAVLYAASEYANGNNGKELFDRVPKERIQETINRNDFESARNIYLSIEDIIIGTADDRTDSFPICNMNRSNAFKEVVLRGYKSFINENNILYNWKSGNGIERFLYLISPRKNIEEAFKNATLESVELR